MPEMDCVARRVASRVTCVSERSQVPTPLAVAMRTRPYTAGLVSQRPALGCLFEILLQVWPGAEELRLTATLLELRAHLLEGRRARIAGRGDIH